MDDTKKLLMYCNIFCYFRIKQNTFKFLLKLLLPKLARQSNKFGRHPILPEKQLS